VPDQALTALLGQGIAGIIAVLFIGLYLRELAEHKASKTEHNSELRTVLEKAAAEAKDVSGRAEYKTQELLRVRCAKPIPNASAWRYRPSSTSLDSR